MLTTILVLETTPLPKHGYLVRYIRATQDRQYNAIISQKLYHSHQIHRGSTFRAEITTPCHLSAQIVSLHVTSLPIEFYPAALNMCCHDISMLDDRSRTLRKLKFLSRFPQRLSRLLDAASPDSLEMVVGLYNAYKIHFAWHQRMKNSANEYPKPNTHNNPKTHSMRRYFFIGKSNYRSIQALDQPPNALPQKTLQFLLHKRSQEVSILTTTELCRNIKVDLHPLTEALETLSLHRTIITHREYVMLTGEFFLQTEIRSNLNSKYSDPHSDTFFHYEIDNALERILLLLRTSIHTSCRLMIHNAINFKISCTLGLAPSDVKSLIPILSSVNDQLCGAKILVITPSSSAYKRYLPLDVLNIEIEQLRRDAPLRLPSNTLVLALDTDTYSTSDLYLMLNNLTSSARLILHSSQSNRDDAYFSKLFHILATHYPTTVIPQFADRNHDPSLMPAAPNSCSVSFNTKLKDVIRLVTPSNVFGVTSSYGQAKKLNQVLQKLTATPSDLIIDFNCYRFYRLDRIIFLESSADYQVRKFSYGTILDTTDSTVYLAIENSTLAMSFKDFVSSKPELAYFLPMRYLKRIHIKEAVILTGKDDGFLPFLTRAISRTDSYQIIYAIQDLSITPELLLPLSKRKAINIIPRVI